MNRNLTIFLQFVITLIGIDAIVFLLWEPTVEGVNAHATTLYEIYFDDPFLALVYTGSIPFFVALYQTFKILKYIRQNKIFSQEVLKSLRNIKYCAMTIIGFVALEEIIIIMNHDNDDPAGGIFMGVIITLGSILIAVIARKFEQMLSR